MGHDQWYSRKWSSINTFILTWILPELLSGIDNLSDIPYIYIPYY